jgi:hypothetical protein
MRRCNDCGSFRASNLKIQIRNLKSEFRNSLMAYDTTLDDVMAPPAGTKQQHRRSSRLRVRWPQLTRCDVTTVVCLSAIYLASSSFEFPSRGTSAFFGALSVTITCGLAMLAMRSLGLTLHMAIFGSLISWVMFSAANTETGLPPLGMIGFALCVYALTGTADGRKHALVWLPLAFVIWPTTHASHIVGLLALSCLAIGMLADAWVDHRQLKRALSEPVVLVGLALLVLCCAASLVGMAAVTTSPSTNLLAQSSVAGPLVVYSSIGAAFFVSIALGAMLLRFSPRRMCAHEVLLIVTFGTLTICDVSMFVWWVLVWVPLAAVHSASMPAYTGVIQFVAEAAASDDQYIAGRSTKHTLAAASVVVVALSVSPWMQSSTADGARTPTPNGSNLAPLILAAESTSSSATGGD